MLPPWNRVELRNNVRAPISPASGCGNRLPIAIPAAPALAGLVVGAQAFAFDAAAPSGIGAVSNGGILRLY